MQRATIIVAAIVTAGLLAGCRNEEQHPMVLGNGTYTGGGNAGLTAKQMAELRNRVMLQATGSASEDSNQSMAEPRPTEVREPNGQGTASSAALGNRVMLQGVADTTAGSVEGVSESWPVGPNGRARLTPRSKTLEQRLMKQQVGGR